MEGEARVLQQRVEPLAVGGRRQHPLEGVRGEKDEQYEADRDQGLDGQRPGAQARRQIASEPRHRRAVHAEDQNPEKHGALVVPPHARDLVQKGFGRVRIAHHGEQREIRGHEGVGQAGKGKSDQQELGERGRPRQLHPRLVAAVRPDHRHAGLNQGDQEGEGEGEMACFRDHCASPFVIWPDRLSAFSISCQRPDFFRASATSGGM